MHLNKVIPFLLISAAMLIGLELRAQNAPTSLTPGNRPETNSLLPVNTTTGKKKHKTSFFSPSRKQNVKHTARYEFYERLEVVAKEKQRMLKKLAKPQYSDPRYFGHKKIPKRRAANKMRYCGECGIRH